MRSTIKGSRQLTFFWPSSTACRVRNSSLVRYRRALTSNFIFMNAQPFLSHSEIGEGDIGSAL